MTAATELALARRQQAGQADGSGHAAPFLLNARVSEAERAGATAAAVAETPDMMTWVAAVTFEPHEIGQLAGQAEGSDTAHAAAEAGRARAAPAFLLAC